MERKNRNDLAPKLGVSLAAVGGFLLDQHNSVSRIGGGVMIGVGGLLNNETYANPVEHVIYSAARKVRTAFRDAHTTKKTT